MSREQTMVTTLRKEPGMISDAEGISLRVIFDLVLVQYVTDGNPLPDRGRGVVDFEPEAHTLVKRYISSHAPLTLIGGGIQVEISLRSAHEFLVVGHTIATT